MILKGIVARRFRGIRKEDLIPFSAGLNIIKGGDNEAGKSSLRMAITKALFQDPTTESTDIRALTSWGRDEPWEIDLEFEIDAETYWLSKSLKDRTCKLLCISPSEHQITNKNAISRKIAEFTGCPSEVFFESTACIGQDELIRIIPPSVAKGTEGKRAFGLITQKLQDKLSGAAGADVTTIVAKLGNKTHRQDAKGPYWHLQSMTSRKDKLQAAQKELGEKVNLVLGNRKELERVKQELKRLNEELPPKQDSLSNNNRILELQTSVRGDKEQHSNFKRAEGLKQQTDTIDGQLGEFINFTGTEAKREQLEREERELQELKRQLYATQDTLKQQERQKPSTWILALGLVLLTGGLAGLALSRYFGISAIAGIIFVIYWLTSQKAWKKQKNSLSGECEDLKGRIQDKDGSVNSLLSSLGFKDYNEYQNRLENYNLLMDERTPLSNQLRGILGDKSWDEFEEENKDLDIRITANQKELDRLFPFKLDPLELQKLDTEVNGRDGLIQKKKDLEGEKLGLDHFFKYTDADTDQLASINDELAWLDEPQRFWERKIRVYEIVRETLDEAHKQTLSKAAGVLEDELGRYISIITDGRYNQVKIDEKDLSIWTSSPEKKELVRVSELSRATQDQFYICARFALVKLITQGKSPPLLLDDPFVNFHPKRLEKTISLLQELAKENQTLLFTCSDAWDNYGNVILLG